MVLAQTTSQKGGHIFFNQLLHQLKEASKSGSWALTENIGGDKSTLTKDSPGLKNKRHVWLNCERILEDIEIRHATARQQAGSIWTDLRSLTSRKATSVSRPFEHRPDVTSDAYLIPDLDKKGQLREIIAHFARDGHIVGVEFQLAHEGSGRLFGNRSDIVDLISFNSNTPIIAVMMSFGSLQRNQDKSAMFGLGIVVENRPSEPAYTIGAWNGPDVIQILRAESGMEVIGITGEFNVSPPKSSWSLWCHTNHSIQAETITTFGIITANKTLTPVNRVQRSAMDLQTNTRWVGRHPPLDWPLEQYSLSARDGDPSCVDFDNLGLDPPVFDAPVYFLNLSERRVNSIEAFGTPDAPDPSGRGFKGFTFTFADGSTETVGQTPPDMKASVIKMQENEKITDLKLHFALLVDMLHSPTKLCGVQVSSFTAAVTPLT
ncbi:hypothetical protein N7474_000266 [Penicillium riverlandense]|uniref:uncharacterized protein n=1 Tax=Penicillium riverlandense TaxID=1903569 RepID=UPI0025496592|nr:uncharacterized protein N7474_000266 [Penicillium riverlandense]KAJ5831955.1 hypothetical protein N7474_000266 [Penicillium riverlandense]